MTNTTNCTELNACSYAQAIADENLPLTSVVLSDGIVALNIYKLYAEGVSPNTALSTDDLRDTNSTNPVIKCEFHSTDFLFRLIGALTDNETVPFHNIMVFRIIDESILESLTFSVGDCKLYNGDISTLPYFPGENLDFSFVRNILLNGTVDVVPTTTAALPSSTMVMTTTTMLTTTLVTTPEVTNMVTDITPNTVPTDSSNNNSLNIGTIVGGVVASLFVIITTVSIAILLFKLDKNMILKIRAKINKIFGKNTIDSNNKAESKAEDSAV